MNAITSRPYGGKSDLDAIPHVLNLVKRSIHRKNGHRCLKCGCNLKHHRTRSISIAIYSCGKIQQRVSYLPVLG